MLSLNLILLFKINTFTQSQMTIITIKRAYNGWIDDQGYFTDIIEPVKAQLHDVFLEEGEILVDDDFVDEAVEVMENVFEDQPVEYVDRIYEGIAVAMNLSGLTDIMSVLEQIGSNGNNCPCLNCLFYGWTGDLGRNGRCLNCINANSDAFEPFDYLDFGTWTWFSNVDREINERDYDMDPDDLTFEDQYFSEDEADSDDGLGVTPGTFG